MPRVTADQVLDTLAGILSNFQGREYSDPIGPQTLFFGNLGLASIDAVILGETLEAHFGQRFAYGEFLRDAFARGKTDMQLGELASFLADEINRKQESQPQD